MSEERARPDITGFLSSDRDGGLSGAMGVLGAEYAIKVEAAAKTSSKGTQYYPMTATPKDGGEPFTGAVFYRDNRTAVGKVCLTVLFDYPHDGQKDAFNAVGFYKTHNRDGQPYKSGPIYSLAKNKPMQGRHEESAPF